ncbi:MAG TPA: response regulator [Bryobacteraceae bacterium]|nr:response regulator [Bryobacteraceae bacterium]
MSTFEQIGNGVRLIMWEAEGVQVLRPPENVTSPKRVLAKKTKVQRGIILVVEDDLTIRELVRMFLENEGYTVVTAHDGEEGLLVYKRHQLNIALLLTDVRMPGMNGVDLADRVLQLDSHLPVVFMSGDAPQLNLRSTCLAKPFNSADLIGTLDQVLHATQRTQETDRL